MIERKNFSSEGILDSFKKEVETLDKLKVKAVWILLETRFTRVVGICV